MSPKNIKKKGQDASPEPQEDQPSKLDYSIASYMKKHTPTKRTKFLHHQVNYFCASKAIDVLLDSQWATGKEPVFTDRQSVVDYCNRLLTHKFFHRAKKIAITDRDLKPKELKKKREKEQREKIKKEKDKKKKKKSNSKDEVEDAKTEVDTQNEEDRDDSKKKKKKIKLDMHLEQIFVDGSDAYIWMYDPVPFWYYIAGALCLLAAVAICLFPLWPPSVRVGVYYLSVAAAGFLGFILSLAVVRFIVFMIIWVLSMGRHHLWLLPNLTEDVGFFASFWPLHHYEYRGADYDRKKSKKGKKKVVVKTSVEMEEDAEKSDKEGQNDGSGWETDRQETDEGERHDECSASNLSDSDNSQHSQPFEMVDRKDLEDEEDEEEEEEDEEDDDEEENSDKEETSDRDHEETDNKEEEETDKNEEKNDDKVGK